MNKDSDFINVINNKNNDVINQEDSVFFEKIKNEKVLVASITYNGMAYCRKDFINYLFNLNITKKTDFLIITNSGLEDKKAIAQTISLLKKNELKINVLINNNLFSHPYEQIISNRNLVRDYFLKGDYDWLFFKDADLIGSKNDLLIALNDAFLLNKKIISGLYFNIVNIKGEAKIRPLAYEFFSKEKELLRFVPYKKLLSNRFIEIAAAGLGFILVHRSVLEKIIFRRLKNSSEDAAFFKDIIGLGFKPILDTKLINIHLKKDKKLTSLLNPRNYL